MSIGACQCVLDVEIDGHLQRLINWQNQILRLLLLMYITALTIEYCCLIMVEDLG